MMPEEKLVDFCRALVSALRSGLPLAEALKTLAKSARYGWPITRACQLAADGAPLHEIFGAQKVLPPVFIALLRAGEEGGKADEFLELYAGCLDARIQFRRRIKRMLIYPVFAVILAGALFMLVAVKVVPTVLAPLLEAGAALPAQAFIITGFAAFLLQNWLPVALFALALFFAIRIAARTTLARKLGAIAGHWLPGFRFATEQGRLYYLYTTMGLLLKAGLPISAMMDVLLQFSQDDPIDSRKFRRASAMLYNGTSFSQSIAALVPREDKDSLQIAEKSGRLDETLLRRANLHYGRHLHNLKLLAKLFNISLLVGLALACFALILAILLPAFTVLSGVKGLTQANVPSAKPAFSQPVMSAASATPEKSQADKNLAEAKRALFNQVQGGKIMEFINKYAVKTATAADSSRQAEKRKLGPVPPIKSIPLGNIEPTRVQPADIKSH